MTPERLARMSGLHKRMANSHPALQRGLVRCEVCDAEQRVNSADCLRHGWPECCGYTMRLVHEDEVESKK